MALLSGWSKRIKITVDADVIDAALSNFPVPVYISAASGIGDVDASCVFDELGSDANRKKIAVTTSDGTTQCYVEIERWDHANEHAWLHVNLPSVSESADTDLYLYYDSSQADNTTYVGDTGDAPARSVWDSNFARVWHLNNSLLDSKGAGNATLGSASWADSSSTLMMTCLYVNGSYSGATFPLTGVSDINTTRTIEFVFKPTAQGSGTWANIIIGQANNEIVDYSYYVNSSSKKIDYRGVSSNNTVNLNTVAYVASTKLKGYLNGADEVSGTLPGLTTDALIFSGRTGNTSYTYKGYLAKLRVSNVNRSAAWIKATYNGLFDSLLTFSSEENIYINGIVDQFSFIDAIDGKATFSSSVEEQFVLSDTITSELTEGATKVSIAESFYLSDIISLRVYRAARLSSRNSVTIQITPKSTPTVSVRQKVPIFLN